MTVEKVQREVGGLATVQDGGMWLRVVAKRKQEERKEEKKEAHAGHERQLAPIRWWRRGTNRQTVALKGGRE